MLIQVLKQLFTRDLNKLKTEIELYQNEERIWQMEGKIKNSGGNLCLHLLGNLNTYIGRELGKTGYIRHRDLEFSQKNVPRSEMIQQIEETIQMINSSLDKLSDDQLTEEYPLLIWKEKTSTEYLLVHLTTHLTYHLGQINYHRRLLDTEKPI